MKIAFLYGGLFCVKTVHPTMSYISCIIASHAVAPLGEYGKGCSARTALYSLSRMEQGPLHKYDSPHTTGQAHEQSSMSLHDNHDLQNLKSTSYRHSCNAAV